RTVELDLRRAGVKARRLAFTGEHRPRGGFGKATENRDGQPDPIDPGRRRLPPLDDDADRNALERRLRAHVSARNWWAGGPVRRFCGFTRSIFCAAMARKR